MGSSEGSTRLPLLAQLCPRQLAGLLNALGDPAATLRSALDLAMCTSGADRGVAFDGVGAMESIGFGDDQAWFLRGRLSALSSRGSLTVFDRPDFTGPRRPGAQACGMAGVIRVLTAVSVIAVERDDGLLTPDHQADMRELIGLIRRPLELTAQLQWLKQEKSAYELKIRVQALPLHRLEALPQIGELELMLIEEAMQRCHGNKTHAAAVLGVSREGLRRKITRLTQKIRLAPDAS